MLLTILSYFQEFLPQMRNTFIFSFIFLLLFSFIFPISIFPMSSHKDTLPVKSNQNLQTKFIKENTNKYFISTKDGYLHALNNNKKEIWKTYLEQELMSSTLSTRKINKDLFLYPMNERLYIYKNGEFINFQIFIKDLVQKDPYLFVDGFTLMGEMKTTLFIIDVDTGEILKKIDNKSNISKKRYILSKNTITVVRIDYILNCLGEDEEQRYWNALFSDIEIHNGNGNDNSDISKFFTSNLREIINEYKSNNPNNNNISIDDIINAYSYFNKDISPVKIYDISYSNNEIEGEIKQLAKYNNEIKNKFGENELETKLKYLEHLNKDNNKMELTEQMKLPNYLGDENYKMKLPNYSGEENIKCNNNLNNNDKNNNNTNIKTIIHFFNNYIVLILFGIIIILFFKLKYYQYFSNTLKKENEQKDKILCEKEKQIEQNNIKNNNIIIDNNDDNKNDILIDKSNENKIYEEKRQHGNNSVLLKSKTFLENIHIKKYSYDVTQKRTTGDSDKKNFKAKNVKKDEKKEISINNKNDVVDNNVSEEKTIENKNEEKNNEVIINSNNNTQSKKDEKDNSITYKDTNGIWDDDDDDNDGKSGNNSEENENESNEDEKKKLIEKNENSQKIEKSVEKSEEKIEKKSKNESYDEEDEEEEEDDSKDDEQNDKEDTKRKENSKSIIKNSKNSSSFISNDNSKSYEHMETNVETNPKESKDIIENKKEKKQSRLDTDFDNLEKIGQGGFGVVLKGRHKIDQDIYAIKIIDITNNSKECEEIVSEAKKMKAIKGEYIVNYTICWYDDNLGSAEKFFEKEKRDSSSQYYSNSKLSRLNLSKSVTIQLTKNNKNVIDPNDYKEIFNIQELDEDKYDDDNNELINNCKCSCKENTDSINNTNNNNSLEILETNNKNQIYNNRSKYCFEYMDDSKLMNKSIISKKFDEEIHQKKQKKYFFILMEYCDGLTLEIFIVQHSNKSIERKIIYNYTRQILKALKKLHKNGIIHRDIKPGNIFIKNEQIKIGDFGLATQVKKNAVLQTKDLRGFTPTYAAPEQTNSKTYNEKVDIYACGITLFEMCGCFGTEMERQLALKDLKSKRIILDRIIKNYPEESKLIKLMTERDYNERPSAEQILKSELFAELGKIVN